MALLATIIIAGYRNALCVLRTDPEAGRLRLAYIVVGLAYGLTEAGFRLMTPMWIAFLLAVIVIPRDSLRDVLLPEKLPETGKIGATSRVGSSGHAHQHSPRPRAAQHRPESTHGRRNQVGSSIGEHFR